MLLLDDYLLGFAKGIFSGSVSKAHRQGTKTMNLSIRLWLGLFRGNAKTLLSRFTFELIQTLLGFVLSHLNIWFKSVCKIVYFQGITVLEGGGIMGSVCFGTHIFLYPGEKAAPENPLLLHEFGHTLQSRRSGPLYLFKYGIPSLLTNNTAWMERDANTRSERHFRRDERAMLNWKMSSFHRLRNEREINPQSWEYVLFFLGIGIVVIPLANLLFPPTKAR